MLNIYLYNHQLTVTMNSSIGNIFTDTDSWDMRQNISHYLDILLQLCHTGSHTFNFGVNCVFKSVNSNKCYLFILNVPVKDRYGDQDEENSSDSSDSDSDESEVVKYSLTFLFESLLPTSYWDFHV